MKSRPVVVHIGFPKTGTTSLQQRLFTQHPGLISFGKPAPTKAGAEVVDCLSNLQATAADISRARKNWLNELAALPDDGRTVVLSNERLSAYKYYADPTAMADRLGQIVGDVKIMITIRHQVSLLESYYLHVTKRGNYRTLEEYLSASIRGDVAHLDFHGMASLYAQRFGAARVGVFPLEQWTGEPARYAARMAAFLNVDALRTNAMLSADALNKRKSSRHLAYVALRQKIPLRGIAHFMPQPIVKGFQRFLSGGAPAKAETPKVWRDRIEGMHAHSNARLAADYGLDLARYGYAVADIDLEPAAMASPLRRTHRSRPLGR